MKYSFTLGLLLVSLLSGLKAMDLNHKCFDARENVFTPESVAGRFSPDLRQTSRNSSPMMIENFIAKPRLTLETLLSMSTTKALFFAVEQGCDNALITVLLNKVLQDSPNKLVSSIIIARVEELFRTKSPRILKLKAKINSGGTSSQQRVTLQKELKNLESFRICSTPFCS